MNWIKFAKDKCKSLQLEQINHAQKQIEEWLARL